jgi:hypothetical protein
MLPLGPRSKHSFHFVLHVLHKHSLKVDLYNIFINTIHETKFQGVELFHLCHHVNTKNVLGFEAFQILDFQIMDVQTIEHIKHSLISLVI